jgi:Sodium/hydrogen exchanger family
MSASELSVTFFLQMAVILGACRLVGALARRVGQPQVVGEMIVGVLLGPSLLGLLSPEIQARIFPRDSLRVLYVGAQLGVGLYMFLVGVEFKPSCSGIACAARSACRSRECSCRLRSAPRSCQWSAQPRAHPAAGTGGRRAVPADVLHLLRTEHAPGHGRFGPLAPRGTGRAPRRLLRQGHFDDAGSGAIDVSRHFPASTAA